MALVAAGASIPDGGTLASQLELEVLHDAVSGRWFLHDRAYLQDCYIFVSSESLSFLYYWLLLSLIFLKF